MTGSPPQPTAALADGAAVARVLEHLVGNAVKFTEAGSVTVTVGVEDRCSVVRVADTGVGIAPPFLARIFGDFEQESDGHDRRYEGSGLGLSVAQRLARLMGGDITVESEKGAGSTFTLRLPPAEAPADARPRPVPQRMTVSRCVAVPDALVRRTTYTPGDSDAPSTVTSTAAAAPGAPA